MLDDQIDNLLRHIIGASSKSRSNEGLNFVEIAQLQITYGHIFTQVQKALKLFGKSCMTR